MPFTDVLRELELLVRSRYGLLHLVSDEEDRVHSLLLHLADRLSIPLFTWNRVRGLGRADLDGAVYETRDPVRALRHVMDAPRPALYHFRALGALAVENALVGEKLREACARLESIGGALVLTGTRLDLPSALEPNTARIPLATPSSDEFRGLLGRIVRDLARSGSVDVHLSRAEMDRLLEQLSGLTLVEAEKLLTRVILEDGRLSPDDLGRIAEAKRTIVEREGVLEYYPLEESGDTIAGLDGFKAWLRKRTPLLEDPDRARAFGLSFPRGVLLVGVPGCGKSLSARAVAGEWSLPLLKLDPSGLYNRYIGESERNFKRAMALAERMAPVVLWIDELEKAFAAGGEGDGGVSKRILGTFLHWMQERKGDVFVLATSNDVTALPPELLRKGRFDEIFFVDLPGPEVRKEIFRLHLERRGQDPARFDLDQLAGATPGFSGAEVEQVVVSGLYAAFAERGELETPVLLEEAAATRPLSIVAEKKVSAIRAWARDRAVSAD